MASIQAHRTARLTTPLGEDLLRFSFMRASEELGRLSTFELDLTSSDRDIDPDKILGKNVTVDMDVGDGSSRYFNGYVCAFAYEGRYRREHKYHATVYPWLWLLTRSQDCRVFRGGFEHILTEVFKKYGGAASYRFELSRKYQERDFCVQYRESDFAFVSRLMEHEGVYYFFEHAKGKHTLVVTDSMAVHKPSKKFEKLPFAGYEREVRSDGQFIYGWSATKRLQSGVYALEDYDFLRPNAELLVKAAIRRKHEFAEQEVFDYPGTYSKEDFGRQYASTRIEEIQAGYEQIEGETDVRGVVVGALFTLQHHPRQDQNREYLVVSSEYEVHAMSFETAGSDPEEWKDVTDPCKCKFRAIDSRQAFRPSRSTPKPFVQGPQTAVVVGPKGEEIYTDSDGYARVRVQFHWDRYGKKDPDSSYWIRVSQPWAGKGWGGVSLPRIGQEVVVGFLEGDPDQPLIMGRVYNGENKPPYPTGLVSGLKSNTHKGKGYNELSMDDTAGKEKITIHAQYDMGTTIEHDDTQTVNNNRVISVVGTHTEEVKGETKITIKEGNYSHDVATGTATHHVTGAVETTYDSTLNLTITGKVTEEFQAAHEQNVTGSQTISVQGPISIESMTKITLSVAGSSITIDPSGVTIAAPMIKLN